MSTPRPFQISAANKIDEWEASGVKSGCVAAPTGAGKTRIEMMAAARRVANGRRGVFLVHRDHLVHQAQAQAAEIGLESGVIKAGWPADPSKGLQICSVQTLTARRFVPQASFVFGDEFHIANIHKFMSEKYPDTFRVGFTATPESSGGKSLIKHAQHIHVAVAPSELLANNWIVPPQMWVPQYPDLSHINVLRGEFDEEMLAVAMRGLVGSVVGHWQRHLRGRKTLCFAVNRDHARRLVEEYRNAGAGVGLIDGDTAPEVRSGLMARLAEGTLDVLVNVQVFIEGYNLPELDCVQLATATQSLARFLQMCGRGCRAVGDKKHYVLVDHGGNIFRHMPPHIDRRWSLDPDEMSAARKTRLNTGVRWCKMCFHVYEIGPGSMTCPHCKRPSPVRVVRERAGALVDITNMVDVSVLSTPAQQTKDHADKYRKRLWAQVSHTKMPAWQRPKWVEREMEKFWREVSGLKPSADQ